MFTKTPTTANDKVLLMRPGFYQSSFNKGTGWTKVLIWGPGEVEFTSIDHKGHCVFEDIKGERWKLERHGEVSFEVVKYPKADSAPPTDPDSDTATQGAQDPTTHTGNWPLVAVGHRLRKAKSRLSRGFCRISTSASGADDIEEQPLLSSQPSNPTSEAGRLTWKQVQSKGDGGSNYPQADIRPWGGTDDGSESE